MIQWLRLCSSNAGDSDSTPGQGTSSHMLQLRVFILQLKVMHAATKTQHSQINILKKKEMLGVGGGGETFLAVQWSR